jgi:hypothetical protein
MNVLREQLPEGGLDESKTNLAGALAEGGYRMAPNSVRRLLRDLGCSLQADRKDKQG